MQADRSESKTPGSRPQVGARFWALPVAVAAVLAMGPVQADPVPDGGPLTSGYGYDAEGNLTTVNLPKGNGQTDARQNTHGYDSLGRRTSSKLAAPATGASAPELGFGYDGRDQLKKVTDPRKLDTTYTTSGLGNTTTQGSPDTGTSQVTYYPDGRVWTVTDSRSKVSTFEYDDLGRLTKISYSAGKASQFEYDGGVLTQNNSTGQLSKLTDESGNTTYTHDGLGRVLTKTQTVGTANQKFTLKQAWGDTGTGASKLQSQTYPSLAQLNYIYDAAGRLQSITLNPVKADGSGTKLTQTIPLLSSISYDALNQVKGWTWGGGVTYTRGFDTQGRLSTYPLGNPSGAGNAAGLIRTVGYDDAGRIVSYTHANGSGVSKPAFNQTFTYDGLDRLKQQQLAASNFAYDYDLSNNRTSQLLGGSTYLNTIAPDSNRLMKERNGQGTTTFTYDNAGNLKTDGTNTFTYSARGRLASVAMATDTVSYLYNALDQRVLKTGPTNRVNSGSRYYAYDEQGHLIGDYDADGSPGTYGYEVVYLGDTPVAVINQTRTLVNGALNIVTNVSYVYADHIDTPRVIVRSSDHAIQWRWDLSEAFGNALPNDNPNALGVFTFNLRFPGQTYDKEAGLSYNHHRDYRAQSGRYVESDPIGLDGGINTYTYVSGKPIDSYDESGLIEHKTGQWKECSNGCRIRIDWTIVNGVVKRHLHWECKGKSGEFGENGEASHGETSDTAPANIKECARKNGFAAKVCLPPAEAYSAPSRSEGMSAPSLPSPSTIGTATLAMGIAAAVCVVLEPCGAAAAGAGGVVVLTGQ